jgi:hypothetical protein
VDFHRQWIEMVHENINATLDFVHQALGARSPSALVELSSEHGRKQLGGIRRTSPEPHRHGAKIDDRYGRANAGEHEERFKPALITLGERL